MPEKKKEPLVPKDKKELHVKPTKQELDEKAQKALEEAEKLKNQPEPTEKEPKKPAEPKPPEKPAEEPTEPEPPKEPNYKKKFIESQRESLILHEKNKKTNEALQKAMETPEPTEEELKKEYSDWEDMSDFEKKMAKDNLINTRRFKVLEDISKTNKNLAQWEKKVTGFIDDPQVLIDNPRLEGKQDEFKLFAVKRQGVDFDVLVSAFLYNATKQENKTEKKKGSMFEQGTGGPTDKGTPKTNKLTTTQARDLRKNDFKKYKEYLNKGLIEEPKFD